MEKGNTLLRAKFWRSESILSGKRQYLLRVRAKFLEVRIWMIPLMFEIDAQDQSENNSRVVDVPEQLKSNDLTCQI